MKNPFVYVALAAVVILAFAFIFEVLDKGPSVCFDDECFDVEVVDTEADRMKGLMFREYLDQDKGMLFVFEESRVYPFWMKNTLISLDMIWIDENYEVVFIKESAMPCTSDPCPSINPGTQALYVLEINGGLAAQKGIELGDKAKFKY